VAIAMNASGVEPVYFVVEVPDQTVGGQRAERLLLGQRAERLPRPMHCSATAAEVAS
jgi:hypothetical protein